MLRLPDFGSGVFGDRYVPYAWYCRADPSFHSPFVFGVAAVEPRGESPASRTLHFLFHSSADELGMIRLSEDPVEQQAIRTLDKSELELGHVLDGIVYSLDFRSDSRKVRCDFSSPHTSNLRVLETALWAVAIRASGLIRCRGFGNDMQVWQHYRPDLRDKGFSPS